MQGNWLAPGGSVGEEDSKRRVARSRVNLDEPHEVRFWTRDLGVDEATLRAVVQAVGNSASAVRRYLKGGKHK